MGKKFYHLPENYQWQGYTVNKVLGEGGYGIVYHATDDKLGRELAIKEYYPNILVNRDGNKNVEANADQEENYKEGLGKFIEEARVLASCDHPNIVKVHNIVEANNTAYIVMPYYQGITLYEHIKKNGRLEEKTAYHYLKPICKALHYVHSKNYLHRDVKPANIFLRQQGEDIEPILLDFGGAREFDAKASGTYSKVLTEGYGPPEQYEGKSKPYTDVYSLGATFYHLVSGNVPVNALKRALLQNYVDNDEVEPDLDLTGFSEDLAEILAKAMALYPKKRYTSIAEFLEACQKVFEPSHKEQVSKRELAIQKQLIEKERKWEEEKRRRVEEKRKRVQAEQKAKKAEQDAEKIRRTVKYEEGTRPRKNIERFVWILFSLLLVAVSVAVVMNLQPKERVNGTGIIESKEEVPEAVVGETEIVESEEEVPEIAEAEIEIVESEEEVPEIAEAEIEIVESEEEVPEIAEAEVEIVESEKEVPEIIEEETEPEKEVEDPDPIDVVVSNNSDWEVEKRDFDGTTMVLVPKGSFTIGSTEEQIDTALELCNEARTDDGSCQRSWFEDEAPTSVQNFAEPFWIDETEVTREEYQKCVDAGTCEATPDSDFSTAANQPINRITWYQAATYCEWREARLPTEAEWEYAARGPDGLVYPWGNNFVGDKANHCDSNCASADFSKDWIYKSPENDDGFARTAPVGSYPDGISWVGALDMSGNVWELTRSLYRDYSYNESDGRNLIGNEEEVSERITLRGGSFAGPAYLLRASARYGVDAGVDFNSNGLRCARSNPDF